MSTLVDNGIMDFATVAYRYAHPLPGPMVAEWAIVYPYSKPSEHVLDAMIRESGVPRPMVMNGFGSRDKFMAMLERVRGPIMLVGRSVAHWRGDLLGAKCAWTLDSKCGIWWDQRPVITCRELLPPKCMQPFGTLVRLLEGESPSGMVGTACVECGQKYQWLDRDAVPYCEECWKKGSGKWEKARAVWIAQQDNRVPF